MCGWIDDAVMENEMKDERVVVFNESIGLYLTHNGAKEPFRDYRVPYANKQSAIRAIKKASAKHAGPYQILPY